MESYLNDNSSEGFFTQFILKNLDNYDLVNTIWIVNEKDLHQVSEEETVTEKKLILVKLKK